MLNIITSAYSTVSGPSKVVGNLVNGLNRIKYPYVINMGINSTKRCYIPNRRTALLFVKKAKSRVIVGPNLYVLPNEIPWFINLEDCVYVQPCKWVLDLWRMLGFRKTALKVWPVGIDTDAFYPKNSNRKKVTIYHKKRNEQESQLIERILRQMKIDFQKITFGNYCEEEYKNILHHTSFVIWHGQHESQGIALQECLASDVPILVCDVNTLFDEVDGYDWPRELDHLEVTAAPYFDQTCGLIIKDLKRLRQSIEYMFDNLGRFSPRMFILENLSLEKQAREFIDLYEHFYLHTEDGYQEKLSNSKGLSGRQFIEISEMLARKITEIRKSIKKHV